MEKATDLLMINKLPRGWVITQQKSVLIGNPTTYLIASMYAAQAIKHTVLANHMLQIQ